MTEEQTQTLIERALRADAAERDEHERVSNGYAVLSPLSFTAVGVFGAALTTLVNQGQGGWAIVFGVATLAAAAVGLFVTLKQLKGRPARRRKSV